MDTITITNTVTPKTVVRVKGYARTSTKEQGEDDKISIPEQEKWFIETSQDHGWEYCGMYIDKLPGDVEFEKRPGGEAFLEDAKDKEFEIALFYHSSRLAREPWIGLKTLSILGKLRIQAYIRNAPIEPVSPDKFIYGVNVAAEYLNALSLVGDKQENMARSERVTMGHRNLAQRGVFQFNMYGLKKIQEFVTTANGKTEYTWHYEKEPAEERVVKDIFEMFVFRNMSLRKICKTLIEKREPSPTGKTGLGSWSAATIRNILSNPRYIRKNRWGRKLGSKYREGRNENGIQKRIIVPQDKWIISDGNNYPRIVEEELFYKAQERLKQRGKVTGRQISSNCLLAGLVWCGLCNLKAALKYRLVKKHGHTYPRWDFIDQSYIRGLDCRRHIISAAKLDAYVLGKLQSRLNELKGEAIEDEIIKQTKKTQKAIHASLASIETELKQEKSISANLLDLVTRKVISEANYLQKNPEVETNIKHLEAERLRLKRLLTSNEQQVDVLRTQREVLTLLSSTTDVEARKAIVRSIIDKVIIFHDKIQILYQFTNGEL